MVNEEVEALLAKGAVEEVSPSLGYYSKMFVVPKKDGGWRPIINLKFFNKTYMCKSTTFTNSGGLQGKEQQHLTNGHIQQDTYQTWQTLKYKVTDKFTIVRSLFFASAET